MNTLAKSFSNFSEQIDKAVSVLVFFLLSSMVLVTTAQIICRVFFTALTWSEELSRYLLVWSTFFAATMAYKRGNHIAITFVTGAFPKRIQPVFALLSYFLSMIFFITVIYYGWQMIRLQVFQISPAMALPMQYIYASLPISLSIMFLHALSGVLNELLKLAGKEEAL